ncbi:phosphotransferase family protein [Bacillus salipaludis]|uniref:Phosphotransferase family protein n=1 Tax=Bacillus salipaludis TaxID=2547811 RepID=A0ABW8RN48_9BACI
MEYIVTYLNQDGDMAEESLIGKVYSDPEKGWTCYQVLKYLWEHGMNTDSPNSVIRPVAYFEACPLLLMSKAPGRSLYELFNQDMDHHQIGSLIADWLKHLHSVPIAKLRKTTHTRAEVDVSRFYNDLSLLIPEKQERLKDLYNNILIKSVKPWNGQQVMLHGDFNLMNLFIEDEKVTAIDFDHHFLGDPAWDVAYLTCQIQLKGFLKKGNFNYFLPIVKSAIETYLSDYPEDIRLVFYNRFYLYRARSLFESLHYELCVLKTGKLDIVNAFLTECESALKGGDLC